MHDSCMRRINAGSASMQAMHAMQAIYIYRMHDIVTAYTACRIRSINLNALVYPAASGRRSVSKEKCLGPPYCAGHCNLLKRMRIRVPFAFRVPLWTQLLIFKFVTSSWAYVI
jgi:hypothetical protein